MSTPLLYAASAAASYSMTGDRVVAGVAALATLAGAIIGGLALARRTGAWGSIVALLTGASGMIAGGIVVATADGGPGTGNGIVGGYVAVALGLVAVVLGGSGLVLYRRAA